MKMCTRGFGALAPLWVLLLLVFSWAASSQAAVLVADRLTGRVLKYSDAGDFVGTVAGGAELSGPNGMTLSPDGSKLYVASLFNNTVVRYDFDGAAGTNPLTISSNGQSVLNFPASVLFSQDGSKLYVANLGGLGNGNTVSQLNPDGTSAGPDLTGGPTTGRSALAFAPDGALLAGNYGPSPITGGGVLKYDSVAGQFVDFIAQTTSLRGAASILINGNDMYVAAGTAGTIGKFNATTGAVDGAFGTGGFLTGLEYPASLAPAPGGNGMLVGILTGTSGAGRIDHFGFDGSLLGTFANNSFANPALGFGEATGLLYVVPEPATASGALAALAVLARLARGRRGRA